MILEGILRAVIEIHQRSLTLSATLLKLFFQKIVRDHEGIASLPSVATHGPAVSTLFDVGGRGLSAALFGLF